MDVQRVMAEFAAIVTPGGAAIPLGIKVAIAAGSCRRFLVGHPRIQSIEILAGAIMDRVIAAEQQAQRGEVVVSGEIAEQLGSLLQVHSWRSDGAGQRFAVVGGLAQAAPTLPSVEDPEIAADIARDWLLPPIYQRLQRGEGEFLGELRPAVPLFLKFSSLDYDQDDQAIARLDSYIRWLQHLLARYEGYLLQVTIGDKGSYCYAIFGAPLAHEDDAARAIAAALEFLHPPSELSFMQPAQVGISQGQMYAGAYGGPNRRSYGVLGNEVNVAARLMNIARSSQILVTARVAEAARQSYLLRDLGAMNLKGQPEPVRVFAVEGRKAGRASGVPRGQPAALVGRAAERATLADSLRALRAGQQGALIVEGEAGIGKSRLLGELITQAEQAGIAYLFGAGDAIDRSTAYHAWRPVFGQLFEVSALADDPAPESRQMLREQVLVRLEAAKPELLHLAPLLNAVLPLDLPDNELTALMSGEVRANNTSDLLVGLLLGRAHAAPLLIALEDAHWFDSASWALARAVVASDAALLLTISTRSLAEPLPAGYTQIRQAAYTQHLALDSLPASEIDTLVCQRLGVHELPKPVSELIRTKAEGHPFFSEELAYALRDAGLIQIADGVCQLAPGGRALRAFDFPDTIQGVVTSRVDRLPPAQQLTLKVASVIGRVFAYATLSEIYPVEGDKPALVEHLERLNRLDITRTETLEPELSYIFKHVLAQEAVYSLLLYAQRQQLHQAVASCYEATYAGDLSPFYPLLAYHWRQADVVPKALEYLEKAGDQALRGGAFLEAAHSFEAALELVEQKAAVPQPVIAHADQVRQSGWRWKLGVAYLRLGRLAQGRELSERAMAVFDQPIPATKVRLASGIAGQLALQVLHRLWPSRFIGAAVGEERERLLTVVSIYQTLSQMYYFFKQQGLGMYAALRQVNVAEQAGPSLQLAQAYAVMCIITGLFGRHRIAEGYYNRALAVAQQLASEPYVLANVLHRGSIYHNGAGQFSRTRADLTQAMEIYQYMGDRGAWRECLTVLTNAEYLSGNYERALQLTAISLTALPDDDGTPHQFWIRQWQSCMALRQDRLADALADLEKATNFLGRGLEGLVEVSYYGVLATARWRQGEHQLAQEAAARATDFIAQAKGVPLVLSSFDGYVGAAEVALSLWEAALQTGQPTRQERKAARRACWHLRVFRWFLPAGTPAAWLYQGRYHWLDNKPQKARDAWCKSLAAAEQLGMPYEQGRAHFEIGRWLDLEAPERQEHLSQAIEIFTHLGATYDVRRAQEALRETSHF
jgi:predicted ATPase/class 3 adenylate cyclase